MKDVNFVWSQTASTDLQEVNLTLQRRKMTLGNIDFGPNVQLAQCTCDGLPES